MGREYIDFWVRVEERDGAAELFSKLTELGYRKAVVELEDNLEESFEEIKSLAEENKLEIYRKLVLEPSGRKELLRNLRENRGKYEVISIICRNLDTALVAARDSRVDTLIIPPNPGYRLDKGVAALLKHRVELPFNWFLSQETRDAFLSTAIKIMKFLAGKRGVIVSSAASSSLELRGWRELASLLEVLGMNTQQALDSISIIPQEILRENLLKLSPNYIARGVLKIG